MKRGRSNKQDLRPLPSAGEGASRVSEGRERGRARSKNAPSPGSLRLPPSPAEGRGLVLVGEFGRAHGLKGEVRLKSHTGDPQAIAGYKPLIASNGKTFSLKNVRPAPGGAPDLLIAIVDGVTTREASEALNRVAALRGARQASAARRGGRVPARRPDRSLGSERSGRDHRHCRRRAQLRRRRSSGNRARSKRPDRVSALHQGLRAERGCSRNSAS